MRIHLDGPDAIGKTPVIADLAERYSINVTKEPHTRGLRTAEEFQQDREWYRRQQDGGIILSDRSLVSMIAEQTCSIRVLQRAWRFVQGRFLIAVPDGLYLGECAARAEAKEGIHRAKYVQICGRYEAAGQALMMAMPDFFWLERVSSYGALLNFVEAEVSQWI